MKRIFIAFSLLFLAAQITACQSPVAVKSTTPEDTIAFDSLIESSADIHRLLALIKELDEGPKQNDISAFPELEKRKKQVTNQMGMLLLAACFEKGETFANLSEAAFAPCFYEEFGIMIDPAGGVAKNCTNSSDNDAFINCATSGILISRMNGVTSLELQEADWNADEDYMKGVVRDFGKRLLTGCMADKAPDLGNCMIERMAGIFSVPDADLAYCKGQGNLNRRLDCVGFISLIALFEQSMARPT